MSKTEYCTLLYASEYLDDEDTIANISRRRSRIETLTCSCVRLQQSRKLKASRRRPRQRPGARKPIQRVSTGLKIRHETVVKVLTHRCPIDLVTGAAGQKAEPKRGRYSARQAGQSRRRESKGNRANVGRGRRRLTRHRGNAGPDGYSKCAPRQRHRPSGRRGVLKSHFVVPSHKANPEARSGGTARRLYTSQHPTGKKSLDGRVRSRSRTTAEVQAETRLAPILLAPCETKGTLQSLSHRVESR